MGQPLQCPLRPHAFPNYFPKHPWANNVNVHSGLIHFPEHPWALHVNGPSDLIQLPERPRANQVNVHSDLVHFPAHPWANRVIHFPDNPLANHVNKKTRLAHGCSANRMRSECTLTWWARGCSGTGSGLSGR